MQIKDSGTRQEFASGMVRDTTEGKIDYTTVRNGPMFERWAAHLTKGEVKYPDPVPGRPNWMRASGHEEYIRARKSAARHFEQWFRGDTDEDHAAATFFNINLAEYAFGKASAQAVAAPATPRPQVAGAGATEPSGVERVYIAGPYSAPTGLEKACNVRAAAELATAVMLKGHDAHCPHTATYLPEQLAAGRIGYERWMRLDFGLIYHWATAILVRAMSPGTQREIELAQKLGLKIYHSIDDIPDITT